jgi:hypothetical protein
MKNLSPQIAEKLSPEVSGYIESALLLIEQTLAEPDPIEFKRKSKALKALLRKAYRTHHAQRA